MRLSGADRPITTGRLRLTPLTTADAEAMVPVLADPRLYTVIGGGPPSLDELRARYERQTAGPDWYNWIVRLPGSPGSPVGTVQATLTGLTAEVAWVIGKPWQGKGYAVEAATALVGWLLTRDVRRVVAHVQPGHTASEAVARAAGLTPTETFSAGERLWVRT